MKKHGMLSMNEFIKLSRTSRDILNHYRKVGILQPEYRDEENKHPYYSTTQLGNANLIRTLQEMGMSLKEIKELKDRRTPENTYSLLMNQLHDIDQKIRRFTNARKLISTLQKSIYSGLLADKNDIVIQQLPAEKIVIGDCNDYKDDDDAYDMLSHFYKTAGDKYLHLDLNYPVWAIFTKERIEARDWHLPSRYYFYNPDGNDQRPAGTYAVGHMYGGYGQTDELYKKILDHIDRNGCEICGNTYEEYPLNEICVSDETNYLIRVMIEVREKS